MNINFEGLVTGKTESNTSGGSVRGSGKDRVILNVGGYRHETYLSTLRVVPDSRLAWIGENASKQADYDPETNEIFFDRHPGVFANVLNYYRTGKLHCPGDVCGPLFEEELAFWGIEELQMEPCCWSNYTQHRDAQATLKAFEGLQKDTEDSEYEAGERLARRQKTKMQQFWALLEQPYSSKYAQILAMVSLVIIILSVTTFCIESMPFADAFKKEFQILEILYCVWFTFEFVARAIACPSKVEFIKNFMTWVDVLSIIPLYISFAKGDQTLDFLFVLRLVRIFRLFRFFRTMSGMQVIGHTLRASARELFLLVLILLIPMVIFSTLVFYAEKSSKSKGEFPSIPDAFWWAIITMTTVGYGDVTPKTPHGRFIGTLCACIGVLIVALPVSVIGSNFTLFYSHAQAQLKLPKKKHKPLLLGAAGVLVSETTLNNNDENESQNNVNESMDMLAPSSLQPRLSSTEFKHLRNPSIIPRARGSRRQGQGAIETASMPFPRMSKIDSEASDSEQSHAKTRSQALSPDTSGSMTNISNGLRGISEVMLQITAPVSRRMAISPCPTPPNKRGSRKKRRLKRTFSGNEESSGHERESFYTTDADSANEGNFALEELKDKMRAQTQGSDSSNTNPHSSKENITSGEENMRHMHSRNSSQGSHTRSPKHALDTQVSIEKSSSHISLEAITIKPKVTDQGGDGKEGPHPDTSPHLNEETEETWVKQNKGRARSRISNCRRSPLLDEERRVERPRRRLVLLPSPLHTPEGQVKRLSCNGSHNDLETRNATALNERRTSSERNVACGHNLSRDTSVSRSLDRIGSGTCRRFNEDTSSSAEFGENSRRVQFINNTVV